MLTLSLVSRTILVLLLTKAALGQLLMDTIGWTDRDHQMYGPAVRYIANDTLRGIHAVWKDSLGAICYNFRPRGQNWRWPDGVRISPYNRNLGSMDIDPGNGVAIIGFDFLFQADPWSAYYEDSAPGTARFSELIMNRNFRHVMAATGRYGSPMFATMRNDSAFHLSLFSFLRLDRIGPFPTHNISGARRSGRYCHTWVHADERDSGMLWMKETPNSAFNWYPTVNLSDSVPSELNRSLLGANALYDSIRLYLVADFYDGRDRGRSELWLYAKYDTPPWHLIHTQSVADTTRLGDQALPCCRPSIARSLRNGNLFAVWEQFDETNIDPLTGLCRGSVWVSRSADTGSTWGPPLQLTPNDSRSWRFPFAAESVSDSLRIICFPDSVAGFWEQGQGPRTVNPVIMLSVAAEELPVAVTERPCRPVRANLPTVVRDMAPNGSAKVYDAAGRSLGIPGAARLNPGVYYLRDSSPSGIHRVVLIR